jgi:hypothetical protein
MRNRILVILFIFSFFVPCIQAQHKEATETVKIMDSLLSQHNISNDSLLAIVATDTTQLAELHFNPDFKEKYRGNKDFNYEQSSGGENLLLKLKAFLSNLLSKLLGLEDIRKINTYTEYVLVGIIVLIFLVVIYVIVRLVMNHKGRWFFQKENIDTVEINYDNVEQHIHEADFESLVHQAEKSGDIRQSIRLYYLWLLKTLTSRNIITWNAEKTNADYTREIQNEAVKKEFGYLSYLYNYIWYGEFSINDDEYKNTKQAFLNQIKPNGR